MHHVDAVEIHVGHVGRWVNAPHWIPNVYGPRRYNIASSVHGAFRCHCHHTQDIGNTP